MCRGDWMEKRLRARAGAHTRSAAQSVSLRHIALLPYERGEPGDGVAFLGRRLTREVFGQPHRG